MPVTVGGIADQRVVRLLYRDVIGEEVTKVFGLDGGALDADIGTLLTNLDLLTNAGVVKSSISTQVVPTGYAAATNALQNTVGIIMALTFTQADPVDATQTITKSFIVPAPVDTLRDTDQKPVTGDTALNALIAYLEDNLAFTGNDGVIRAGGWTYQRAMSGFGSVNRELDGQ
jgi:hypothetical protein